jgi:hypothetical protein
LPQTYIRIGTIDRPKRTKTSKGRTPPKSKVWNMESIAIIKLNTATSNVSSEAGSMLLVEILL